MRSPGTALITGASSGIGAEFASQLAARGHPLVLVARRRDRLEAVAAALGAPAAARLEILPADLATEAGLAALEARIAGAPDLALLVNNAGFGMDGDFLDAAPGAPAEMARVHVEAVLRLCAAALPGMLARGGGAIVNVASVAGFLAAGAPAYNATKAFQIAFSRNLDSQVGGRGIAVQALCPGYTLTGFHGAVRREAGAGPGSRPPVPGWMWLSPERVVRDSLRELDRGRGRRVVVVPGTLYKLSTLLARGGLARPIGRMRNLLRKI